MASSSTSSIQKSFKYEVFLSFRGEMRLDFVSQLFGALQEKNHIYTYKDDVRMKKGKEIADDLDESIKNSKFYIVVFSKEYASSLWCLNELVNIMKCHKEPGHAAYSVFYDVKPSEVGQQKGEFGIAFDKLKKEMTFESYQKGAFDKAFPKLKEERTFEGNQNKAFGKVFAKLKRKEKKDFKKWKNTVFKEWEDALRAATAVDGWELEKTADRNQYIFVQKIVGLISLELCSTYFSIDKRTVGMNSRIEDVLSSLGTSCDDVRMVGIKGIGGGGKTTLARAVYDRISLQFEGKSFVKNVREVSHTPSSGLKSLQNQILSDILNNEGMSVSSVDDGKNMLRRMMAGRKVLLVLDDVDDIEQLEALAGDLSWFKSGSRIIITTRDEQVLKAHEVELIHNVKLLSFEDEICLFSRYVFGVDTPVQGYDQLSRDAIHYTAGLPLYIRHLGIHLRGKNESEWIDTLARLKTIPLEGPLKVLELSYLDLDVDYKKMFLFVATMLKGWSKDSAIKALESCGFHARIGLRVLELKSIITIDNDYMFVGMHGNTKTMLQCIQHVGMHDSVHEMAKYIVRRSHLDEPNKHSQLWIDEEIKDVLANDLGAEATRCIRLHTEKVDPNIVMKGFTKMKELRFLDVSLGETNYFPSNWKHDEVSQYFPNSLQYLSWKRYPFMFLPKTFQANNIVSLEMSGSDIIQLWEGGERKVLNKLKFLDLSLSMLTSLDLYSAVNLETLDLGGCKYLVSLHLPHECRKLISVDLSSSNLETVNLHSAVNLELLDLKNCFALVELQLPHECRKLTHLKCMRSKVRALNLMLALNLEELILDQCEDLVELHFHKGSPKLTYLNCTRTKLKILNLRLAQNLKMLILDHCNDLVKLLMPGRSLNLHSLRISHSKLKTLDIGMTPKIKNLNLNNCYKLEELHMAEKCQKLASLNICHSKLRTLDLELTPNLEILDLRECNNLVQLHAPTGCLKNLVYLDLTGCLRFTSFLFVKEDDVNSYSEDESPELSPELSPLAELNTSVLNVKEDDVNSYSEDESPELSPELSPLAELNLTAESLEICSVHPHNNLPKFQFKCFYKDDLPSLNRNLETLISIDLCACTNLETFSQSICGLQRLGKLKLEGYPEVPKNLNQLECLEELSLSTTNIEHLPDSICKLKQLKSLELRGFKLLEKLPDHLGRLQCLEELILSCEKIKRLPDTICMLKQLKSLELKECELLEKLPEDLGQLQRLELLSLSSKKIKYLPDSICILKHLKYLRLSDCKLLEKLPEDLGLLQSLVTLSLSRTNIKYLPDTICMLKNLVDLTLDDCSLLVILPKDLGGLERLETLAVMNCKLLRDIPISICEMKCLRMLDMDGTCISHLHESIRLLEGLRIFGSRELLQSCGFTTEIQTSGSSECCYVEV